MFENIEFAPLPGSMMAISLLGFLLTVVYRDSLELTWTFTLGLFFLILFLASFLSLHYGPLPEREVP
ncbi:hypothetical protein JXB27_02100 [Candidatus Woesearchaeota archaeon]|nr:hypothetical protein [Candidatus Woesearchaeota archaeon]